MKQIISKHTAHTFAALLRVCLSGLLLVCASVEAQAQTAPKAENFTLPNAVDGRPVSLTDYKTSAGVVLVFMSNHCPYAKLYEDRLIGLAGQFAAQNIQFIFINSNYSMDNIDDSVEEMAARAREKAYPFPYLADKKHKVATSLGATKTPEVFLLQNTNGNFTLRYRGAIDDNPQVAQEVTAFYLRDAIKALLGNHNMPALEKRPTGCAIKKG